MQVQQQPVCSSIARSQYTTTWYILFASAHSDWYRFPFNGHYRPPTQASHYSTHEHFDNQSKVYRTESDARKIMSCWDSHPVRTFFSFRLRRMQLHRSTATDSRCVWIHDICEPIRLVTGMLWVIATLRTPLRCDRRIPSRVKPRLKLRSRFRRIYLWH